MIYFSAVITKMFPHGLQVKFAKEGKRILHQKYVMLNWALISHNILYCFLYISFWGKLH